MPDLLRQRDIIDRLNLAETLAQVAEGVDAGLDRRPFLAPLRQALADGRAEIHRRFEAEGDATDTVHEQCFLIDQLIRVLFDFVGDKVYPIANPTAGEKLAIVAVGGYGRGEMAPFSDIYLFFLLPYKRTPHTQHAVEYLLSMLVDPGLNVGNPTT